MFNYTTAARLVKAAMNLSSPTLFCVIYCGQQANSTAGALVPIRGGGSDLALDDARTPTTKELLNDIAEELDDDGVTRRPNPRSFPMSKTGIQLFDPKLRKGFIRQL